MKWTLNDLKPYSTIHRKYFHGKYPFSQIIFLAAYKHADGKKIDGKRVLVDVERARTVKGWLPRRLGKFNHIFFIFFSIIITLMKF